MVKKRLQALEKVKNRNIAKIHREVELIRMNCKDKKILKELQNREIDLIEEQKRIFEKFKMEIAEIEDTLEKFLKR